MKINMDVIVKDNDPVMRKPSKQVELPLNRQDRELIMDMLTYVKNSHDPELCEQENLRPAVGIAAVQVGVLKQMVAIAIDLDEDTQIEHALINPRIVSHSVQNAYLENGEGCLSVEDEHEGHVFRHARITVKAYDAVHDEFVTIRAKGYEAIVLQHEIDHLSGVLFYDHIDQLDPWKEDENAVVI